MNALSGNSLAGQLAEAPDRVAALAVAEQEPAGVDVRPQVVDVALCQRELLVRRDVEQRALHQFVHGLARLGDLPRCIVCIGAAGVVREVPDVVRVVLPPVPSLRRAVLAAELGYRQRVVDLGEIEQGKPGREHPPLVADPRAVGLLLVEDAGGDLAEPVHAVECAVAGRLADAAWIVPHVVERVALLALVFEREVFVEPLDALAEVGGDVVLGGVEQLGAEEVALGEAERGDAAGGHRARDAGVELEVILGLLVERGDAPAAGGLILGVALDRRRYLSIFFHVSVLMGNPARVRLQMPSTPYCPLALSPGPLRATPMYWSVKLPSSVRAAGSWPSPLEPQPVAADPRHHTARAAARRASSPSCRGRR